VCLEPLDEIGLQRLDSRRDTERAVVHVPPGTACDLRQLARRQVAVALSVKLAHRGEGHVVEIEIEPHADGVGGDQEIDIS